MRVKGAHLLSDRGGLALMEFAFVLPFLLLILYGGIEITRFMLIAQRVDKSAYALADITNQFPPATATRGAGEINETQMRETVFAQYRSLMEPYDADTQGSAIITSLRREGTQTRIKWQVAGGGNYVDAQTVSVISGLNPPAVDAAGAGLRDRNATFTGELATLMGGMYNGENMIVSEVFFRYRPFLDQILAGLKLPFSLGETTLSRRIFTRPRNGDLACLPPTFTYSSDC